MLLALFCLRAGAVEERSWKNHLEKTFLVDRIVGARDHAQRGDDVADDRIFGERASVRETARNPRRQEASFRSVADLVTAVEQRVLSPLEPVRVAIATQVPDDPRDLRVLGRKRESRDREQAIALRFGVPAVLEYRSVDHDQPARERDHLARAAA